MFAPRHLGRRERGSCSSPATATGSSRSTRHRSASTFLFGSEIKSFLAAPRFPAAAQPRRTLLEYFTFQNIFTDGTLFHGVTLLPPGHTLTVALDGSERSAAPVLGLSTSQSTKGGASDDEYAEELDRLFRAGGRAPARERRPRRRVPQRRHGLGQHHGRRGPRTAAPLDVHRRLRPHLRLRARARLGRADEGGGDVLRLRNRAVRDGAEGRRHGALPPRSHLAPRGSPGRPVVPELLHRAAREQVRQGRAFRQRRRRALRRLSVALLPRRRQRRLRPVRGEVLRLLAPADPEQRDPRVLRARRLERGPRHPHDRHLPQRPPAARAADRRRSTSTTRSTSRRRPSCTACSSSTTS